MTSREQELFDALAPFVAAYRRDSDPGTSDLYNEQPFAVIVKLGDIRKATQVYMGALQDAMRKNGA